MRLLGDGCVFEQRVQFRVERQAQRNRRLRAGTHIKAGLLVGCFGHIEQRH